MRILVTGALGLVGGVVYRHFSASPQRFEVYALSRRRGHSERTDEQTRVTVPEDRLIVSDLSNLEELTSLMSEFECVVHMAADPRAEAPWENISTSNILASYNVFEAGSRAGVKRVVYASTVMVSWGYYEDEPYSVFKKNEYSDETANPPKIMTTDPVRPTCLYASSKVFGEALARTYASESALSCLCLRIGAVNAENKPAPEYQDVWCSHRDIAQIVERCVLAAEHLKFGIFYGVSESPWRWVDIDSASEQLGYVPQDDASREMA